MTILPGIGDHDSGLVHLGRTPGCSVLRGDVGALVVGLVLVDEGEDAWLVESGETWFPGLLIGFKTRSVGPEPTTTNHRSVFY